MTLKQFEQNVSGYRNGKLIEQYSFVRRGVWTFGCKKGKALEKEYFRRLEEGLFSEQDLWKRDVYFGTS